MTCSIFGYKRVNGDSASLCSPGSPASGASFPTARRTSASSQRRHSGTHGTTTGSTTAGCSIWRSAATTEAKYRECEVAMCRWMTYMGDPIPAEELFRPAHSIIDQSPHAQLGGFTTNGDGFGIGWYGDGPAGGSRPARGRRPVHRLRAAARPGHGTRSRRARGGSCGGAHTRPIRSSRSPTPDRAVRIEPGGDS
jgi:hypothetical protein